MGDNDQKPAVDPMAPVIPAAQTPGGGVGSDAMDKPMSPSPMTPPAVGIGVTGGVTSTTGSVGATKPVAEEPKPMSPMAPPAMPDASDDSDANSGGGVPGTL